MRTQDTCTVYRDGGGGGGGGVVLAVFNSVSRLGADKSLTAGNRFPMIHAVMAWTESDRKSRKRYVRPGSYPKIPAGQDSFWTGLVDLLQRSVNTFNDSDNWTGSDFFFFTNNFLLTLF